MAGGQGAGAGEQHGGIVRRAVGKHGAEHEVTSCSQRCPGGQAQSAAQIGEPLADVTTVRAQEPVGVQGEHAARCDVQLCGPERQAADPQRRPGFRRDEFRCAAGSDDERQGVARAGQRALAGDRVVDCVQACGRQFGRRGPVLRGTRLIAAGEVNDHVVELGEELVGRQIDICQSAYGGTQQAHGGSGVDAVADGVADNEGHACPGQRDDVEPVSAYPCLGVGGKVARIGLHGQKAGQVLRQQAALQGHGGGTLTLVAAGVVEGDGGHGRDLPGIGQVIMAERAGAAAAPERHRADQDAACRQLHRDQRAQAVGQEALSLVRIAGLPLGRGTQVSHEAHAPAGGATGLRHGRRNQGADWVEGGIVADAGQGYAAPARRARAGHAVWRNGSSQVDGGVVSEPGDRYLQQVLSGLPGIERVSHRHAGVIQQPQAPACRFFPPSAFPERSSHRVEPAGQVPDLAAAARRKAHGQITASQARCSSGCPADRRHDPPEHISVDRGDERNRSCDPG